jgi:hypothetical protein
VPPRGAGGRVVAGERALASAAEHPGVELASLILRRSLGALGTSRDSCAGCRRIPVAGELLHVFESGKTLCSLCLADLPEAERSPLRSERVHVGDRRLPVVPKAA